MSVYEALRRHRAEIAERWVDELLAGHPGLGADFFRSEPDPFRNPVGTTLRREVPVLLDGLLDGGEPERFAKALDAVVRLRAVSGMRPSQALAGLFALTRLVREVLEQRGEDVVVADLAELEERVGKLVLRACDLHVAFREQMAELRLREARASVFTLLRRAGMLDREEGRETAPADVSAEGARGGVQT